jgi:hypothetical protein
MNRLAFQSSVSLKNRIMRGGRCLALLVLCLATSQSYADTTNVLVWSRDSNQVTADVHDWKLLGLLEEIAGQTGWHVFVEPDENFRSSVKFENLSPGVALRLLLGDMNFALVPQTNAAQRLYVFRTTLKNATNLVHAAGAARTNAKAKRVPNELIIRVKPGTDIDALARRLGAKIVGRIPELDAYRLQFEDEAATERARILLAGEPDVTSVQDNYYIDSPPGLTPMSGVTAPETQLKLDPPKTDACKNIIGLVDTGLPQLSPELEQFITKRQSVVGDVAGGNEAVPHSVAMVNTLLQAIQATEKGNTSLQIVSVNVFGQDATANTFNVAAGLITAGNLGATVINASLGGYGDSAIIRDAGQQLYDHGIPVFTAVGNDGSNKPFFPAADPHFIPVTATDRGRIAAYANVGTSPAVAAPGTVIFSFNGQTYASLGTSVSTAVATGMAAAMADANCAPWSQVIPTLQRNLPVPASP